MKQRPCRSIGKGALVSHRCHLHMLDLIKTNLGCENMQRLLSSQFGFLFPFPNIQFQGQMFNILLRHLVKESEQRNRLEFCVGGRMLEFTPRDFAVITGLRFNGWFEPPLESETHRVLFRRRLSISLDEIAAAFNAECSKSGGKSLNSLRLACLLVVFGVFLTMGGSVNHVELKFLHLIDDLDGFLRFPWGRVAYDSLVKRTHRARDVLEKHMMKQKTIAFDANSFVLALQVWAYEVIPILGRNCASMLSGSQEQFPRLRRWTSSVSMKYSVLQGFFSKLTGQALTPIMPTEMEQNRLAELGFSNPLKRDKGVFNNAVNAQLATGILENGSGKERNEAMETGLKEQLRSLMKRMDQLEHYVYSLIPMGVATSVDLKNTSKRIASAPLNAVNVQLETGILENGSGKERHETMKEQLCNLMKRMDKHEHYVHSLTPIGGATSVDLKNASKRIASAPLTETFRVSPTKKKSKFSGSRVPSESFRLFGSSGSDHDVSPDIIARSESCNKEEGNKKVCSYDPNEMGVGAGYCHEFNVWRVASQEDPRVAQLTIPCKTVDLVKSEWFDTLWSREGWLNLNTSQMDALINLLLLSSKYRPNLFGSGWTAMEMICWDVLRGTNDKVLFERVSPYVVGDEPENNPVPWDIAIHVYGVGNVGGDHWVSYVIDLDEKSITVFDSLSMTTTWDSMEAVFNQVSRNLEKLCERHDVWRNRKGNDKGKKWKIDRFKHPPQQTNDCDCGILAIKYIECLVSGNNVGILDEGRCGFFRHSYCAKLFKVSKVMPDNECNRISVDVNGL